VALSSILAGIGFLPLIPSCSRNFPTFCGLIASCIHFFFSAMTKLQRKIQGRGHIELVCGACGVKFTRPHAHVRGDTNACSTSCSHKIKPRKQKTLIQCVCKECKTVFQVRKGRGGTNEYCSIPCLAKARGKKMRNSNHPNWKGGTSERAHSVRKVIYSIVKERGKCEECGTTEHLQGHHIKSHSAEPALRADPQNIQVLCRICHAEKHPRLKAFILSGGVHD
jgi:5-methylcytosine-specific restriction endonuclease McrA